MKTRPVMVSRPGLIGLAFMKSMKAGVQPDSACSRMTSPSRRQMMPSDAPHSDFADSVSVVRTDFRSNAERLMTFSTSAVAVCCCSDSLKSSVRARSSSNNRTFSMAMTACSAKLVTSSICLSRKRRDFGREMRNGADRTHHPCKIGTDSTVRMPARPPRPPAIRIAIAIGGLSLKSGTCDSVSAFRRHA